MVGWFFSREPLDAPFGSACKSGIKGRSFCLCHRSFDPSGPAQFMGLVGWRREGSATLVLPCDTLWFSG